MVVTHTDEKETWTYSSLRKPFQIDFSLESHLSAILLKLVIRVSLVIDDIFLRLVVPPKNFAISNCNIQECLPRSSKNEY